jgi:competence protein ComFB
MKVYNVMEGLVAHALDSVLKNYSCCDCEQCRMDMMAIALNKLPPRYIATDKGEVMTKADQLMALQSQANVITEVTAAIEVVKSHPRH